MNENDTKTGRSPTVSDIENSSIISGSGNGNHVGPRITVNLFFLADPPPDIGAIVREAIAAAGSIRRLKRVRKSVYASARKDTPPRRRKQ